MSLRDRDGKCDGAGIEPAPVFLFQLDAECKIARSGVEQQTVIKVLCIKDLSELFRRHQVIALQFVVKRQMTVFADLVCDMHGKLSDGIFNHPIYLF